MHVQPPQVVSVTEPDSPVCTLMFLWVPMETWSKYEDNSHVTKCVEIFFFSYCGWTVKFYLAKCVEDSLRISVFKVQGHGILETDDWLLELLQPCPHQTCEDEGIPLHAKPFPCATLIQLRLQAHIQHRRVTKGCETSMPLLDVNTGPPPQNC